MAGALDAIRRRRTFTSLGHAELRTSTTPWFRKVTERRHRRRPRGAASSAAEQTNSSAVFGNRLVMKMFRRAQEGVNPDLEIGRYLTEAGFPHTAPLLGALEYGKGTRSEPRTIGVVYGYVPNEGDAWHYTLDQLGLFYESALHTIPDELDRPAARGPPTSSADPGDPRRGGRRHRPVPRLGRAARPAHRRAARGAGGRDRRRLRARAVHHALPALGVPVDALPGPPDALRWCADRSARSTTTARAAGRDAARPRRARSSTASPRCGATASTSAASGSTATTTSGQVLHAGRDFVIIDFEGEPSRSPTERRIKRSRRRRRRRHGALVPVRRRRRAAEHARTVAWSGPSSATPSAARGRVWEHWVTWQFLRGLPRRGRRRPRSCPATPPTCRPCSIAYTLDKALYEVRYELNHRPTWADIPLRGVQAAPRRRDRRAVVSDDAPGRAGARWRPSSASSPSTGTRRATCHEASSDAHRRRPAGDGRAGATSARARASCATTWRRTACARSSRSLVGHVRRALRARRPGADASAGPSASSSTSPPEGAEPRRVVAVLDELPVVGRVDVRRSRAHRAPPARRRRGPPSASATTT